MLPSIINNAYSDLADVEPINKVKSWITDFRQQGKEIVAKINGIETILVDAQGVYAQAANAASRGFPAGAVMRSMSSVSSAVGKVFKSAAPFAGPLGVGLSVGASLVSTLSSLFGSTDTPPMPTVDGIDAGEFESFLYGIHEHVNRSTKYDRYVEVAADLISGKDVHGSKRANLAGIAEAAVFSVFQEQLTNILLDNRGKEIATSNYRHLAMLLAAIDGTRLKDLIKNQFEPAMIPNLAALMAYGAPRIQLRKALSYYGVFILADTARAAGGYNKCADAFWTSRIEKNNGRLGYNSQNTGFFTYIDSSSSALLRKRPSEKTLCDQLLTYGKVVAARSLPVKTYDEVDGRYDIIQQIPRSVIEEELAFYANEGAPDFKVRVSGLNPFKFTFDGADKGFGLAWPNIDVAIAGMFNVAKKYGVVHLQNLAVIKRDIETEVENTTRALRGEISPATLRLAKQNRKARESRVANRGTLSGKNLSIKSKGDLAIPAAIVAALFFK